MTIVTHQDIGIHFQPSPSHILFHPADGWIARGVNVIFGNLQLLTEVPRRACIFEQRHNYESEEIQNKHKVDSGTLSWFITECS